MLLFYPRGKKYLEASRGLPWDPVMVVLVGLLFLLFDILGSRATNESLRTEVLDLMAASRLIDGYVGLLPCRHKTAKL